MKYDEMKEESFRLKSDCVPILVMQLNDARVSHIEQQLQRIVERSPTFFHNTQVLIDARLIEEQLTEMDFLILLNILKQYSLIPVGMRLAKRADSSDRYCGLPIFKSNPTQANAISQPSQTKLITKPLRAGMQVYAPGGDLIVVASVNSGSECFADGNIHIYGPLRGRAFAGLRGDTNARIFCRTLEAELVAISGYYRIQEDILTQTPAHGMVQIHLDRHKKLIIDTV